MALESVLLAYDCKPPAVAALDTVADIVEQTGAKLTIVCVLSVRTSGEGAIPPGASLTEAIAATRSRLARVQEELARKGVTRVETLFLEGDPVERVLEAAQERSANLIVVGSRGLSTTGRFFLGSVSDGILHHAKCPVLVVKSGGNSPAPARP